MKTTFWRRQWFSCDYAALVCCVLSCNFASRVLSAQRIEIITARGEPQATKAASPAHVRAATFTPGGTAIVLAENDGRLELLRLNAPAHALMLVGATPLADPVSFAVSREQRVILLDRQPPKLIRLSIASDSARAISSIDLPLSGASAVCVLGDLTYVLGSVQPYAQSKLVHVFDTNGRMRTSFGEPDGSAGAGVRIAYSNGALACLAEERLVIMAPRLFPEVHAYSADGHLVWRKPIKPFVGVEVTEPVPGMVKYVYPPSGIRDEIASLFHLTPRVIVVQVSRRESSSPQLGGVILTQLLSTIDGHVISEQRDLPLVLAASASHLVVTDSARGGVRLVPFRIIE